METFWCIFVGNSTFVSPPSEHEELYIVYNCSLARTVLHEYSHIYFVLIWIACAGFLMQRKIKQIQELVACMDLWTVIGLLSLHTFIFCLRKLVLQCLDRTWYLKHLKMFYLQRIWCVVLCSAFLMSLRYWLFRVYHYLFLVLQYKLTLYLVPSWFSFEHFSPPE